MVDALDSDESAELKTARNRLRDLSVPDVDIVDRPANRRPFLIVKKEDGMSEETQGSEFATGDISVDLAADPESGMAPAAPAAPAADDVAAAPAAPASPAAPAAPATPADNVAKAEEIKKAAQAHAALLAEKVEAIKKIADEIATGASSMDAKDLRAKIGQLESLGWKIDDPAKVVNVLKAEGAEGAAAAAAVAKAIPTPVRDAVVKALREGAERLMSVNVALQGATVTQDNVSAPLPDPVAREIRAIRTLVKSVVERYPSPGGAAKSEDAVVPEPLEVGYETAHDLMKQASSGMTLPAPVRDAVAAKVRGASELLLSIVSSVAKMETTEEQVSTPLPQETSLAVAKALSILDEVIEKYPAPAAKSDDVLAQLGGHFKAIQDLVSSLAGGTVVVKEEAKPVEDPRIGELMKSVAANTEILKKVAGIPAGSNALADEGRIPVAKGGEGDTEWPLDLAAD